MWQETVRPILNPDMVDERARDLEAGGLNGLRAALVSFEPPAGPGEALVELHFFNALHLADVLAEAAIDPGEAFPVRGGHRVPAGPGAGQVKCLSVSAGPTPESLSLVLAPVGDYSTYMLELAFDPVRIDPFFAELGFKFRPGCFTNDCAPEWEAGRARLAPPVIDYMAKDYDSFRHTLIAAMMERVPGWQVSSEADLDQVLIGLFAAAADELSDYQDRVMNEAYLTTARKRVSLARHARLMDYHIHQGQQASTWLAVELAETAADLTLDADLLAWAGGEDSETGPIFFATRESPLDPAERTVLSPAFNTFHLHTWADAQPALRAGAASADIVPAPTPAAPAGLISAADLAAAINEGRLTRLLIAERLNPLTGREPGRDPRKRQVLRLVPDARVVPDPLAGRSVVRARWREEDALAFDFSFTTWCPDGRVGNVSVFQGNLVRAHEGLPVRAHFHEPGSVLPDDMPALLTPHFAPGELHRHFERWRLYGETRGVRCALPAEPLSYVPLGAGSGVPARALPPAPLAYLPVAGGGEVPPRSTLRVTVAEPGGAANSWDEVPSLVHSDDTDENGDHFVVETDERQRSRIGFGNGVHGRLLPEGAIVHCEYQAGGGDRGNVGADAIRRFAPLPAPHTGAVARVTNPFDVTDGREPEPAEQALRSIPEAYRSRQLRAVTLRDYAGRAEEVPGVSRAVASYAWTGSWRTVRIVVDPEGATTLDPALVRALSNHLEAVRLIGEDLEIRPPRFVPVEITVALCVRPDSWPEDVRFVLEQEFSTGHTPDGRRGFFHPDEWTFGQALHRSQIAGRLHGVAGVEHVISIAMRRFDQPTPGRGTAEKLEAAFDEILEARNDPDHMERGFIRFDLRGGRQ